LPSPDTLPNYFLIPIVSFGAAVLSTPFIIKVAHKYSIVDKPSDPLLKIHKHPTPALGGLAILFSLCVSWVLILFFQEDLRQEVLGVFLASCIVFLFGLYDDIKELKPALRIVGQLIAAMIVIFICKITVNLIPVWYVSIPLTVIYLMLAMNSINLLDGIDGIATGTTLVASLGFTLIFFFLGNLLGVLISLTLLGATIGFLIYNFNPARIFLGDNGSTVLGLLLGVLAVSLSSEPFSLKHFVISILILAIPFLDTSSAVIRRLLRHRSIFYGDRDHLYDWLMKKGFSQRQTSLFAFFFGLLFAALGILLISD